MKVEDMNLELEIKTSEFQLDDTTKLVVRNYLTVDDRSKFVEYVALNALDDNTGTFSPLRVEIFYSLAVCHFYADIDFPEKEPDKAYDLLESNKIIMKIMRQIPSDELNFMESLTRETIRDMARYYSSAAGIIQGMSINAEGLDQQIGNILDKVKNAEGLELLSEIRNINGTPPEKKKKIVVKKG